MKPRPRRNASKNRGGSKIRSRDVLDLAVADADVQRALALDAREVVGADRARALGRHGLMRLALLRNGGASALKVRNTRTRSASSARRAAATSRDSEAVLGDSIGPKQP